MCKPYMILPLHLPHHSFCQNFGTKSEAYKPDDGNMSNVTGINIQTQCLGRVLITVCLLTLSTEPTNNSYLFLTQDPWFSPLIAGGVE